MVCGWVKGINQWTTELFVDIHGWETTWKYLKSASQRIFSVLLHYLNVNISLCLPCTAL